MFDSLRKKDNQKEIFGLIDEGFGALESGQLDQAAASAERILAIEANQVDALFLLGRVAQRRERLDLAQDFYERAILAKPDFIDPYLKMMEILLTGYQWEEALAVCRLALSRVKPTLDQLVDICTALTNEFPEQIRELLKPALDRNNTNSRVWTAYQEVLHRTNVTGPEYDLFMAEMRDLFPGTLERDAAEALALSHQNRTEEAIALNQRFP